MKWFKHMTNSFRDEKLLALRDEVGLIGYGFFWLVMELVAEKVDENNTCEMKISYKNLSKFCGISVKKSQTFLKICENLKIFDVKFLENDENQVIISIPNLLKYKDEHTQRKSRKSGVKPEQVPSKEEELELEEEREYNNSLCNLNSMGNFENFDAEKNKESVFQENLKTDFLGKEKQEGENVSAEDPHTDFLQIRESYSKLARAESEMTGYAEYKTLVASRQCPPLSRLFDDISKRFEGKERRFNPSLKRYLAEQMWTAKIEKVPEKQEIATPKSGYDDDYQRQVAQRVLKRREERRNAREKENSCLIGNG